jgi:predicted transglutaminase-like cysteine proteinase
MDVIRSLVLLAATCLLAACQSPGAALDALPQSASIGPTILSATPPETIGNSTAMPAGAVTAPPSGYVAFCGRDPDQCAASDGATAIVLDPAIWHTLDTVNRGWNTAVKPEEDAAHYGQVDYWTIPKDGYGDCEDYALGKRKSLVDMGVPAQALRLAIARTADGTAHTVLIAVTNRGDYVLDNLNSAILPWTATDYHWIARQVPGQNQWAFIGSAQNSGGEFVSAGIMR